MNRKKTIVLSSVAIFVTAVIVLGSVLFYREYYDKKVPNFSGVHEIYVYPDTPVSEVYEMIARDCGVKKLKSLKRVFKELDSVKTGHYTIDGTNPSIYVVRMLSAGWQSPVNLVLSGTMRSKEKIAGKVSAQMLVDSVSVLQALNDEELLSGLGFDKKDVFALFIPDTYQVYWTDPVEKILSKQKEAYDAFWNESNKEKAKTVGLSPIEVSVLASIVKGETNYEPEMPCIAGVYLNRLRKGMKLQADPTIAYCFDYKLNRILNKHLRVDSPFNTYKHTGLPPAPICVPTKAALNAVLNPDTHGYIFFCASEKFDGTHRFAVTYAEHKKNARAFQSALNQRQKEKQ